MKYQFKLLRILVMFLFFCLSTGFGIKKSQIGELVTEYHTNPVGIDVEKPRLSWKLFSDERDLMQTAYEIRVANSASDLIKGEKILWSSGKVDSDKSINVVYKGPALESMQHVYWQVRIWDNKNRKIDWSEPAYWEMGILKPEQWKASWIAMKDQKRIDSVSLPGQYFRNEFKIGKKIKSARAYVTSQGLYEMYLNGKKVGDQYFTPGWTSYNKRLQYQVYDVTRLLQRDNAIGAMLGDGWYRGNMGWKGDFNYYGDQLALLVQIQIDYEDGTSELVTSNNNWKASTGPILKSDIYNGEMYDARLEMDGWATNGFGDSNWSKVMVIDEGTKNLVASQGVPVKIIEKLKPVKMIKTPKGETVLDFGQNMVGKVRMKVSGPAGTKVTMQYAEVLDKEGNFYTDNLRSAEATDVYVLKGGGEEVYEPFFTFHGFRYLKLENYPGTVEPENFTGLVIHSDMEPTGSFTTSDSLINQLQSNIQWGQKGNFLDIPTDTPARDERMGWTGDVQAFVKTATFNFDVAAFFTKWMDDLAADQLPDGKVPHVIPDVLNGGGGATGWADAVAIVPWTIYLTYGDTRILEENYSNMVAWVEYMHKRAGEDNLWIGDRHFGDWLSYNTTNSDYPGATTEKDLIATAYYYHTTELVGKIAGIIGKESDVEKYEQLAKNIKQAFVKEFVTPNGRLVSHTQTAYALALSFNLLPEDLRDDAGGFLAKDVEKFGHLTTGFLGTPLLNGSLSEAGRDDLAFMLLNRKEYPSWLYPVTQGATTMWERWDGQKPDGTFQTTDMNSFNHYAYGAIGEWLYQHVAGLQADAEKPGYKHTVFNPHPGGGLTSAKAEFKSMYGLVSSGWEIQGEDFVYTIVIPANTTATVILPEAKSEEIVMNSAPLKSEYKKNMRQTQKDVSLKLGSGTYQFKYPAKKLKTEVK